MDDRRFVREPDSEAGPETPREIPPWRGAMNRVFIGIALGNLTLNFWGLDILLPAAGRLLILLGLRVLRRENRSFQVWWYAFLAQTAIWAFDLLHKAALGWRSFDRSAPGLVLTGTGLALELIQLLCLWRGLRTARRKAGLTPGAGSALALVFFHLLLTGLAVLGLTQLEWPVFIGMLIAYLWILRGLLSLSRELDEAGFAIQPAPVRIPNLALALGLAGTLLAGAGIVSLTLNRLPMDWRPVDPAERSQAAELKAELLALGFPEYALDDLAPEDILSCASPLRVVSDAYAQALTNRSDDEAPRPLTTTGVAVELAGERERWRIFHHFQWDDTAGFYGADALSLWPAYLTCQNGWTRSAQATGRVLYDRDGAALWSPYHFLGEETFTSDSKFFGARTSSGLFASFSFPRRGERRRGYVTYEVSETQDGWVIDSWCNYAHARRVFQYPAMSAMEWIKAVGISSDEEPFFYGWDALQFYPNDADESGVYS